MMICCFCFFKQKTAFDMRISDWSSDVCSSDLDKVSGFVFKIQANMDPNHRDRIAFLRLCSGHFKRGAKLKHSRSGKTINVHNPVLFLARDRELDEEAWPGDIIGIPNHGNPKTGEAIAEGEPEDRKSGA